MSLQPGYNLVTERVGDTDTELGALEFFRRATADEPIDSFVTVTGLEDLVYNADANDRSTVISELRNVLRQTNSIGTSSAVQFLIDGRLFSEDHFRVRIERSGEGVYLDLGEVFVDEPRVVSPKQAVATK